MGQSGDFFLQTPLLPLQLVDRIVLLQCCIFILVLAVHRLLQPLYLGLQQVSAVLELGDGLLMGSDIVLELAYGVFLGG